MLDRFDVVICPKYLFIINFSVHSNMRSFFNTSNIGECKEILILPYIFDIIFLETLKLTYILGRIFFKIKLKFNFKNRTHTSS